MKKNELKQLAQALDQYSKEELVDLLQHIIRLYVLDESLPSQSGQVSPATVEELKGLTFRQLLALLQSSLALDELSQFSITPQTVMVDIGGQLLDLNGPAPSAASVVESDDEGEEGSFDAVSERVDSGIQSRPWRSPSSPSPSRKRSSSPGVETVEMKDLFIEKASSSSQREAIFSFDPPEPPPPIAASAPGDVVEEGGAASTDFARTAQSREEEESAVASEPPALAEEDKQIDPSNRYGSLDFDD